MKHRPGTLEAQRRRIAILIEADPTRSNFSISREVKCSHHTVARVREREQMPEPLPATNGQPQTANAGHANLIAPAEAGNDRARRHGAYSEVLVAPLRAQFLEQLRERLPAVPDELLRVQAHRAAQLELLTAWTDEHGIVRSARSGEVFGAAMFAERLASAYERQHDRLMQIEAEAVRVDPYQALEAHLAQIAESSEEAAV